MVDLLAAIFELFVLICEIATFSNDVSNQRKQKFKGKKPKKKKKKWKFDDLDKEDNDEKVQE